MALQSLYFFLKCLEIKSVVLISINRPLYPSNDRQHKIVGSIPLYVDNMVGMPFSDILAYLGPDCILYGNLIEKQCFCKM